MFVVSLPCGLINGGPVGIYIQWDYKELRKEKSHTNVKDSYIEKLECKRDDDSNLQISMLKNEEYYTGYFLPLKLGEHNVLEYGSLYLTMKNPKGEQIASTNLRMDLARNIHRIKPFNNDLKAMLPKENQKGSEIVFSDINDENK
ncbi:15769_t:CDS:1 [Dentiscutata heterogama]|uniref:15769_t:CDS:1 n=1 Tax=Dentiscutata heterogama TaxID=1316150 RepID=A0ACA9NAL2_9GLOM|nr:15769_t:CDS:1 [Dentiscutata heterogama]